MICFIVLALAMCLFGLRFRREQQTNCVPGYLDKRTTSSVCGIFVCLIFIYHFLRHIDYSPWYDYAAVVFLISLLNQLLVAPFLFYSGYGISEQFKQKKSVYWRNFPLQRFGKVYLIYLFCLIVEFVINGLMNGFSNVTFDFLWLFVWNSHWFIFVILIEYAISWLGVLIVKNRRFWLSLCVLLFSLTLAFVLYYVSDGPRYYNTIVAFPFGVIYSLYINEINGFLRRRKSTPWIALGVALVVWGGLFLVDYKVHSLNDGFFFLVYYVEVIAFIVTILMFTYLFQFGNKALVTLHGYTIWSYLLQNISFALFSSVADIAAVNKYLYFLCCLVFTAALCFVLRFLFDLAWRHTLGKARFREATVHDK